MERHSVIPAVYLFLERDGQVLLLLRQNTGFQDGNYGLIAGHAETGESFKEAMVREAQEEAGIQIKEEDLQFIHVTHKLAENGEERIDVYFEAHHWEGELTNMEPEKCGGLSWFPLEKLPDNCISYITHAFQLRKEGIRYSEGGWKTT